MFLAKRHVRSDFSCPSGDDNPDITVIVPHHLKIDCASCVRSIRANLARRGLTDSSLAKNASVKAKSNCQKENDRRCYQSIWLPGSPLCSANLSLSTPADNMSMLALS